MVSRIIHVGHDTCHRIAVLQSAGYHVELCASIAELGEALAGDDDLDAVLISEGADGGHVAAVELARTESFIPLILFRDTQRTFAESYFDLVVPILAPPQTWLDQLAALIAKGRAFRSGSKARRLEAELHRSSELTGDKAQAQQRQTRAGYSKKVPPQNGLLRRPGNRH